MEPELKKYKDVPELIALRLCTIGLDGDSSLVSLTHRVLLAELDENQVDADIPHVEFDESLTDDGDDTHERRAALEAGITEEKYDGFPGWNIIFDYLDKHPELFSSNENER